MGGLENKKYFLVGIGGAGMSAIALVLKGMGFEVAGSDIKESRYTKILENEGIGIHIGHKKENIRGFDSIVYSAAIPKNNVELKEARNKNLKIYSRSDVLALILNSRKGIAVSGTHGKTTTTSMISLLLRGLGIDPTIIIGGELNELGSNARYGEGEYVVAEACESDGSFLKYIPYISVVTNIENDHIDFYKNYGNLRKSFLKFINNTSKDGYCVFNGDEIKLEQEELDPNIVTYGIKDNNHIYAKNIKFKNFGSSFDLMVGGLEEMIKVELNIPGIHNIKNSLAAFSVCYCMGLDLGKAAEILKFFTGVKRRFEKRGEKRGALIFDDYAHHPSEIKATIKAAVSEKGKRIISVFQPHRYSRLSNLLGKFGDCFHSTDVLIITDVYGAGEQPLPGINGKALVDDLIENNFGKKLVYIPKLDDISMYLDAHLQEKDLVLLMGAGDITRVTDDLLKIKNE